MNTQTLIAFLRGVMPSGKNAVKMADIRRVLGDSGLQNVRTWIQSGNIAFETASSAADSAAHIHERLQMQLNVDLAVIVKTPAELQQILAENPFTGEAYDGKRVFFALANQPLADTAGWPRRTLATKNCASARRRRTCTSRRTPHAANWATPFWKNSSASA